MKYCFLRRSSSNVSKQKLGIIKLNNLSKTLMVGTNFFQKSYFQLKIEKININPSIVTIAHKILETNWSFYVEFRTTKSSISVFQETFSSTDKIFISGGGLRTRQKLYKILSRSGTCKATRIYQCTTNNQASFHLW